jgi:hypothetical protein
LVSADEEESVVLAVTIVRTPEGLAGIAEGGGSPEETIYAAVILREIAEQLEARAQAPRMHTPN